MKKMAIIIIFTLFGLFVIGSITDDEVEVDTNKADAIEKKKDEKEIYPMKFGVKAGDILYYVHGTESKKELTSVLGNKTTNGQFLIVNLFVGNDDKEARTVDGSMFKLLDANGKEYESSVELDTYVNEDIGFFLQKINPGMNKEGKIVFEIPADAEGLVLEVSSGFGWSGGEIAYIGLYEK